nr:probable dolichyl pyrophosphate Man9GlcNAc2 alpha-1,3-glucosyltransferase isoform X2 [Coffea arabica]
MEKMKIRKNPPKPKFSDPDTGIWSWIVQRGTVASFICISLFALLVRVCVSLHPYSGAGNPPKYGDYEAQRHWMEITINLPVKEWYRNSTINDLNYWGLDYPPLTAYQSYFHGLILRCFDPKSVSLYTSRGYESYIGKLLMRWTVLSSDALIFFPAVLYFINVYYSGKPIKEKTSVAWHIALILLNPCLILIDHGHFQFNCISLGLTVAAVAAILSDRDVVGSVLFSLALNHKQMSAYFAPAFFSYLLGKCLRQQNPVIEVAKLGLAVLGTFAVVWSPYLYSAEASLELIWKPRKSSFLYGLLNSALAFYLFSFQVHEKSILLPLLPASFLATEKPFVLLWLTQNALVSMFPLLTRDKLIIPYIALHGLFILLYHSPGGRPHKKETQSSFGTLRLFLLSCFLVLHVVYLTIAPPRKYPFLFEAVIMLLCFSQFVVIFLYTNTKQWTPSKLSALSTEAKKHL